MAPSPPPRAMEPARHGFLRRELTSAICAPLAQNTVLEASAIPRLHEVTDSQPDLEVNMLAGVTPVTAIGVASVHFKCKSGAWKRVLVADVHAVPESDVTLYCPSALFEQHGVRRRHRRGRV